MNEAMKNPMPSLDVSLADHEVKVTPASFPLRSSLTSADAFAVAFDAPWLRLQCDKQEIRPVEVAKPETHQPLDGSRCAGVAALLLCRLERRLRFKEALHADTLDMLADVWVYGLSVLELESEHAGRLKAPTSTGCADPSWHKRAAGDLVAIRIRKRLHPPTELTLFHPDPFQPPGGPDGTDQGQSSSDGILDGSPRPERYQTSSGKFPEAMKLGGAVYPRQLWSQKASSVLNDRAFSRWC